MAFKDHQAHRERQKIDHMVKQVNFFRGAVKTLGVDKGQKEKAEMALSKCAKELSALGNFIEIDEVITWK